MLVPYLCSHEIPATGEDLEPVLFMKRVLHADILTGVHRNGQESISKMDLMNSKARFPFTLQWYQFSVRLS